MYRVGIQIRGTVGTMIQGLQGLVVWGVTEIAAGFTVQLGWTTKPLVRFKFN